MKKIFAVLLIIALACAVYYFFIASHDSDDKQKKEPLEVSLLQIEPQKKRLWTQFSGVLDAVEMVEVRPRVRGSVQKILFKEGSYVKAGQPLFVIDPRPYQATLAEAKAALNAARSAYKLSQVELKRAKKLVDLEGISRSEYDEAVNQNRVNRAAIDSAQASVKEAALDVRYANIHAPVSGTIGRPEITLGNIVEAGANSPTLTTIVSTKDLFAEFDVDETTYLKAKATGDVSKMPVEVVVNQPDIAPYKAVIKSFDNQLDTQSGTIRARAYVNNDNNILIPGLYVTVRLGSVDEQTIIEIPDEVIQTDQSKKFVYVMNNENKVSYRDITVGSSDQGMTIVTDGLSEKDMVITDNLQKLRPDMPVKEKTEKDESDKSEESDEPDTSNKRNQSQ